MKTIYKDGREVETVASAEHFIEFEEHFDLPFTEAMGTGKLSYFYYLSWLTSDSGLEFKEWAKTMRDVDPVKAEETVPFDPVAQAGL
jgi:hypothetical protein